MSGGVRLAVVSPHLDDAVLSLGATIARHTRQGADVRVVTVLAGDPGSNGACGTWDRRAGFSDRGEAARARRAEDERACALLGAEPVWLPLTYDGPPPAEDVVWTVLRAALADADLVLVPGYPLRNPAHAWVARLVLGRGLPASAVGLYLEQPYVWWREPGEPHLPPELGHLVTGEVRWESLPSDSRSRRAKRRACRAYGSQAPLLRGRRRSLPIEWRVALYERRRGGETVAWLPREEPRG